MYIYTERGKQRETKGDREKIDEETSSANILFEVHRVLESSIPLATVRMVFSASRMKMFAVNFKREHLPSLCTL